MSLLQTTKVYAEPMLHVLVTYKLVFDAWNV